MVIETSYTLARAQLARLLNQVTENHETVVIRRRKGEAVAMIAAGELAALTETAHLLRSPRNAERLLTALARARAAGGASSADDAKAAAAEAAIPASLASEGREMSVRDLRRELGLDGEA
jgi:antitoxin YefM